MPSLSDKLKSLGVQMGTQNIPAPREEKPFTFENVLGGHLLETHHGETYVVESHYSIGAPHGQGKLEIEASLDVLGRWLKDEAIVQLPAQSFAFIDTETTGLSGGSGTYAFLIGVGRFEAHEFHLAQFFMHDPIEESAQLAAFEEFIAPCQALVSFNGKTFDIPILNTRFTAQGLHSPLKDLVHIDLLHLARRLWRNRLPSRTLGNIEVQILDASRSEEDVPGWMIPSLFFDYLRNGDARPLRSVFYHNAIDVISLAALLNHIAGLLSDPILTSSAYGADIIALARLFEDMHDLDTATQLYIHGLNHEDAQQERLPRAVLLDAISRLAHIYKNNGDITSAISLWEQAAQHQHIPGFVELAKVYEHQLKEYDTAVYWSQAAVELCINQNSAESKTDFLTAAQFQQWQAEFQHRLERLERKKARRYEP